MNRHFAPAAVMALVALSGCASITGTTNQSVSIQTFQDSGAEVPGAVCELNNNKGKWYITTPGSTMITRSNDDMQVICKKAGQESGQAAVVSAIKGSMFGNILFGGGIGAIIDHNSGAAYEYPAFFRVVMGKTVRIEPEAEPQGTATAPAPSNVAAQPPPAKPSDITQSRPAAPAVTPASFSAPSTAKSTEERLQELKKLHDAGLIDTKLYLEQQRRIIEAQ